MQLGTENHQMEFLFEERTSVESAVVSGGDTFKCKRVFQDGIISLQNTGRENAGAIIAWKGHAEEEQEGNQFTLEIAPGTTIEFEIPRGDNGTLFLDCVCVDLICGGPVEISFLVPNALLN